MAVNINLPASELTVLPTIFESPAVTAPTMTIPDRKVPAPNDNAYEAPSSALFDISAMSNKSAVKGAHGAMPTVNPIAKIPPEP